MVENGRNTTTPAHTLEQQDRQRHWDDTEIGRDGVHAPARVEVNHEAADRHDGEEQQAEQQGDLPETRGLGERLGDGHGIILSIANFIVAKFPNLFSMICCKV